MYLSAVVESARHECGVFVTSLENNILGEIRSWNPRIVGFSMTTGEHITMVKLASRIKKEMGAVTIFGGAHPTVCPDIICRPSRIR